MKTDKEPTDGLQHLRKTLTNSLNISEIKGIIFDMGGDPELLSWSNRAELVIEWLQNCQRLDKIEQLQDTSNRLYPFLSGDSQRPKISRAIAENPFFVGGRINDPKQFFGRSQLLREVRAELKKRSNVSLIGDPQVGKSSFLYYLYQTRQAWLPDVEMVYLDMQSVLDEEDFIESLLGRIGREGNSARELKRAITQRDRDLILLLDEMELLAETDFNPRLHNLLRAMAQEPHFALCLVTHRPLVDVFPARKPGGVSPFHNIFTSKQVAPFALNEARRFLIEKLDGSEIDFSPIEMAQLVENSAGHPAKLQKLAKELFAAKAK